MSKPEIEVQAESVSDSSNNIAQFLSEVKITQTEVFIDKFKVPSVKRLEYRDGPGSAPGLLTLTVYLPETCLDIHLVSRVELRLLDSVDAEVLKSERDRCMDIVSELLAKLNDTEYYDLIIAALREIEQGEWRK